MQYCAAVQMSIELGLFPTDLGLFGAAAASSEGSVFGAATASSEFTEPEGQTDPEPRQRADGALQRTDGVKSK